jgi:hypothetical protein
LRAIAQQAFVPIARHRTEHNRQCPGHLPLPYDMHTAVCTSRLSINERTFSFTPLFQLYAQLAVVPTSLPLHRFTRLLAARARIISFSNIERLTFQAPISSHRHLHLHLHQHHSAPCLRAKLSPPLSQGTLSQRRGRGSSWGRGIENVPFLHCFLRAPVMPLRCVSPSWRSVGSRGGAGTAERSAGAQGG